MIRAILFILFFTNIVMAAGFVSMRDDVRAARRDAWEARIEVMRVIETAHRTEAATGELGGRVTDVERLVIELQDGVPPEAYRRGFPTAGDGP